jgi:hypothetical protein
VPNFEQMISQRVQAFVTEITELARQQALETLSSALVAGGRGRPGRPKNGHVGQPARVTGRRGGGRDRGGNRRSPEEIDRASQALLSEIQSNPGLRVEQIGRALGAATKDLTLPLKKLLSQKMVRSEGQRRATRYFPGGAGGKGRGKGRGAGRGRGKRRAGSAAAAASE